MVEKCKNCVTCQNCFSCEASCYTCEAGYTEGGVEMEIDGSEDVLMAIYKALEKIAIQLEYLNRNKQEELLLERRALGVGGAEPRNDRPRQVGNRKRLEPVDKELKFVPDEVGKLKIEKSLELD